jgi:hypothetical protein
VNRRRPGRFGVRVAASPERDEKREVLKEHEAFDHAGRRMREEGYTGRDDDA